MPTIKINNNGYAIQEDNGLRMYRELQYGFRPALHTFFLTDIDLVKIYEKIDIEKIKTKLKEQAEHEKDLPF